MLSLLGMYPMPCRKLLKMELDKLCKEGILHKVDTSSFFNHKLDEESSKLTTFGTPFGRYRYLRMPMGASLSSDIYQYKVGGHLEHIENCVGNC